MKGAPKPSSVSSLFVLRCFLRNCCFFRFTVPFHCGCVPFVQAFIVFSCLRVGCIMGLVVVIRNETSKRFWMCQPQASVTSPTRRAISRSTSTTSRPKSCDHRTSGTCHCAFVRNPDEPISLYSGCGLLPCCQRHLKVTSDTVGQLLCRGVSTNGTRTICRRLLFSNGGGCFFFR